MAMRLSFLATTLVAGTLLSGPVFAVAATVGETTLVIGSSSLTRGEGERQVVTRGMPVKVGDRIETNDGGHVHIRFVDGAFVSVRPGSRLLVEDYRHAPGNADGSAIKFKLEQGTVRSITGQWGEAARERFRLNTPIAAIGVRGTDFVVQADSEQLRAAVLSGAIVVTPLGEGCRADTLGPCATGNGQQLAADMGKVMLEFQRRQVSPRIVPLNDLLGPDAKPDAADAGARRDAPRAEQLRAQSLDRTVAEVSSSVQPGTAPVTPPALVWGRLGNAIADEQQSRPLEELLGTNYTITLGNGRYTLMRDRTRPALPAIGGVIGFTLADSAVEFVSGGVAEAASASNGKLAINFDSARFTTQLSLSHSSTGTVGLDSAGLITSDGLMVGTSGNAAVAGAVGAGGSEAAYLFSRGAGKGFFNGITRWTVSPSGKAALDSLNSVNSQSGR